MCNVDVIIPTNGKRPQQLLECLSSISKQTLQVNTVVVFNNHAKLNQTLIEQILAKYNCTLLYAPYRRMKGSDRSVKCNFGLQETYHEYVAFLDDDVTVPPSWVESALKYFNDPHVAGVTSGCMPYASVFHRVQAFGSDAHFHMFKEPVKVISIPGYNSVYLRKALDLVGGFNESIGGCEDWELNYRLRRAGWILLGVPEMPVNHRHNYTCKSFVKQMFGYGWSRSRLLRKTHIFTPQHALPTAGLLIFLALLFLNPVSFLAGVIVYFLLLVGITFKLKPSSAKSFFQTVFVFMLMHFSWANGYLKGLVA